MPATRGIQIFTNKLAICLIGQTLLQKFSEDKQRQAQVDHELLCADTRVKQARQRLSRFSINTHFFSSTMDSHPANDESKKANPRLQFSNY